MTIERPTARYGRQQPPRHTRRWLPIALFVAFIVFAVAVAFLAYQRFGTDAVKGELGGYELLDGQTVAVTIIVTRSDPSRPAVCIVRARSSDGTETGRREILVPPSTYDSVQVRAVVKTIRPPSNGDIYGCGMAVPPYLVAP